MKTTEHKTLTIGLERYDLEKMARDNETLRIGFGDDYDCVEIEPKSRFVVDY